MASRVSRVFVSTLLCAVLSNANAACLDNGNVSVFASPTFDSFQLFHLLGPRTYLVTIPGKSFRLDDKQIPGHALYMVDDKVVQSEHVERRYFASYVRRDGEAATLEA